MQRPGELFRPGHDAVETRKEAVMTRRHWLRGMMVATSAWLALAPSGTLAQANPVKMEWFSWSIFRFTSPAGKGVLANPFVKNPDSPIKVEDLSKVDAILVADGHTDEVGSADEIALKTGAKIISTFEMAATYFEPRQGAGPGL